MRKWDRCRRCGSVFEVLHEELQFGWCRECLNRAVELHGRLPFVVFHPTPEPKEKQVNPFAGILLFSAVETATVAVWGAILGVGKGLSDDAQVLAITVLFVGYVVEHIIAFNVGKGRPVLSFPKP